MKITALIYFVLFITISSYAQVGIQNKIGVLTTDNDSLLKKENKLVEYVDTLSKRKVKSITYYKDGDKIETREYYFDNGRLAAFKTFKNDTLNGRQESHEMDGKTVHYFVYQMGKKLWYGVTYEGKMGYSEVYVDGEAKYGVNVDENGNFTGISTIQK